MSFDRASPPSSANPLPVQSYGNMTRGTDRSGTITSGGTAQDLMVANASRNGWMIQNQSTGDVYVMGKGLAGTTVAITGQPSLRIPAGALFIPPFVTPDAISIIGATTGQAFSAWEW
jgi:hypothetical protein